MSFALEKVPAVLHSCELHGKRAKRNAGDEGRPPTREKKVALTLDVTDARFRRILDECWAGSELLVKSMSGADSPAQDLASHKKMDDVRIRVLAVDGRTEVFSIAVARSMGRPTLRIGAGGSKVQLSMRVVGPIASDNLRAIDDHCEADVYVDVAVAQTDIDDVIDGDMDHVGVTTTKPKRGRKPNAHRTQVYVQGAIGELAAAPEAEA